MHDFNAQLIRSTHANYIRWMHVSPQRVDVSACDKAGIVEVCPAGDKEKDAQGRQWEQRMEVMRDSMIYFRNHPGILFWEAGNNSITPAHLRQMADLQTEFDPHGGRVVGCRTLNDEASTPIAGYFGVMIGQDARTDALGGYTNMFRAYSAERRDRAPLLETEDFRDEAARRFWDDFWPPPRAIMIISSTAFPIPIPPAQNGPATLPFTGPIPTRMDASRAAKSAASAARWIRSACPRRLITFIA
jgi:beta-galactosidase